MSFADGSTTQDGVPVDTRVNLHGLTNTFSFYATDTLTWASHWHSRFPGATTGPRSITRDRLPPDATRRARFTEWPICVRPFQSRRGPYLQSACVLPAPTSATAKRAVRRLDRTGLRGSERTLQSAERACERSASEPGRHPNLRSRRAQPGRKRSAGTLAGSGQKTSTIFCSWHRNRPGSDISRTSARPAAKGAQSTSARASGSSHWAAITRSRMQLIRARKR